MPTKRGKRRTASIARELRRGGKGGGEDVPVERGLEQLDRKRRLALCRACAELLHAHTATKAEPHAAPGCTSGQAAAVVDHVGSQKVA